MSFLGSIRLPKTICDVLGHKWEENFHGVSSTRRHCTRCNKKQRIAFNKAPVRPFDLVYWKDE